MPLPSLIELEPDFDYLVPLIMAQVLKESGRYLTEQSYKNSRNMIIAAYIAGCITALICGFWFGFQIWGSKSSPRLTVAFFLLVLAAFALISSIVSRKMNEFDRARRNFMQGATGEAIIARAIEILPNEYMVINDLQTPYGNLDHIVVGPNGVFIVETKNWKGLIDADECGGILLNGESPKDSPVRTMIGRMMEVRKQVAVLCNVKDANSFFYFKAAIAFPSAFVRAKWGKTGSADCVTGDTLEKFIITSVTNRPLTKKDIKQISSAFLALADMAKRSETHSAESPAENANVL